MADGTGGPQPMAASPAGSPVRAGMRLLESLTMLPVYRVPVVYNYVSLSLTPFVNQAIQSVMPSAAVPYCQSVMPLMQQILREGLYYSVQDSLVRHSGDYDPRQWMRRCNGVCTRDSCSQSVR